MSDIYAPKAMNDTVEEAAEKMEETAKDNVAATENAASDFMSSLNGALPESMREMAESALAQTRESYEKAKDSMEETVQALEKSFDAYGAGAAAFQQRLMEIAQANMNSSFDFAKQLTEAKDFSELASMQTAFLQKQFSAFSDQAGEIRALSAKLAEDASEPLKSQFAKTMERFPAQA